MHPDMRAVKKSLMTWGTGIDFLRPAGTERAATVVLEHGGDLDEVLASGLVGQDSVVLVPAGGERGSSAQAQVVAYEGSLTEPGVEMSVGDDFFLEVQDYSTSAYMSLLGPTLIRVTGEEDLQTYLEDADLARTEGTFREFATHPAVQFADQPGLGAGAEHDGPQLRLYVAAGGSLSTSPGGVVLGRVGAPMADLRREWQRLNDESSEPCAVCLGGAVPEQMRAEALAERPWLGRYLLVLGALREMKVRQVPDVRVSGFGGRMGPDLPLPDADGGTADRCDPTWPLLLHAADAAFLVVPRQGRTIKLSRRAGEVVDALLTCGSPEAASRYVPLPEVDQVHSYLAEHGVALSRTGTSRVAATGS